MSPDWQRWTTAKRRAVVHGDGVLDVVVEVGHQEGPRSWTRGRSSARRGCGLDARVIVLGRAVEVPRGEVLGL
eukprot:14490925-Alexandrium_andersonii.AAC.1